MEGFRRRLLRVVFAAVLAGGIAVALAVAGASRPSALGAAAGVWLAISVAWIRAGR